jgi:hypothetical protein
MSSFQLNVPPLDVPDMYSKPGTPCNNYQGYCDVFQKCREVTRTFYRNGKHMEQEIRFNKENHRSVFYLSLPLAPSTSAQSANAAIMATSLPTLLFFLPCVADRYLKGGWPGWSRI